MCIVSKIKTAVGNHPIFVSAHDIGYSGEIMVYHKEAPEEETKSFLEDIAKILHTEPEKTTPQGKGLLMTRFWI